MSILKVLKVRPEVFFTEDFSKLQRTELADELIPLAEAVWESE